MNLNKLGNKFGPGQTDSKTLMPAEYIRAKHQSRANVFILMIFAVVMSGVISAFVLMRQSGEAVVAEFDRVNTEYMDEQAKIEQLRDLEGQRSDMIARAAVASALIDRVPRSVLLGELTRGKPADIVLTEVDLESKRVVVPVAATPAAKTASFKPKGEAEKVEKPKPVPPRFHSTLVLEGIARVNNDIADYLANLKDSPLLMNVELDYIKETTVGEERLRKFKIIATLSNDADAEKVAGVQPFVPSGTDFAVVDPE